MEINLENELETLDECFSYRDLKKFREKKNPKATVAGESHIRKVLCEADIYSPLDLIKEISPYIEDARSIFSPFHEPLDKFEGKEMYTNFLKRYRHFGEKSINLFLDYLESQEFNFSKDYAKQIKNSLDNPKK